MMTSKDPLLPNQEHETGAKDEKKSSTGDAGNNCGTPIPMGWTADGLPVGQPMMERSQWDSSICSCLGGNDEFCSSDIEVCLLGSLAPCFLYGTNAERLESASGSFTHHCLPYTGLYFIGNTLFGWNCLGPWFSYPLRTAIRRKFNLQGSCEASGRSCGCCNCESYIDDEVQREQCM